MKVKALGLMIAVFLALFAVAAAAEDSYVITKVEVDGIQIDGDKVQVDIGESMPVKVFVKLADNATAPKEARIKVWLYGSEYSEAEETTEVFDLNKGVLYSKSLSLDLPSDMEAGSYTLHVRVYDQTESVEQTFTLFVEKSRHMLEMKGFNVNPSTSVNAGDLVTVTARVKNVGSKTEDVTVSAKIPKLGKLGLSQNNWLELDAGDILTSDELELLIPKSTESGEYEMILEVLYSDGHKFVEQKGILTVHGVQKEQPKEQPAQADPARTNQEPAERELPLELPLNKALLVSMDATSQSVPKSKEAVFKVSLASFDSVSRLITFKASGAQLFGDVRIDPSFIQLAGGQKAETYVSVKLYGDAEAGAHNMMLQVTADGKLVQEIPLTVVAVVEEQSNDSLSAFLGDDSNLKIIFVVLVVLLIVIGLLVAFRRVRHDDYPLEPHEDHAYY